MSDLAALALILTNPGVHLLVLALLGFVLVVLGLVTLVLSSDKLSHNLARILRAWRRKK